MSLHAGPPLPDEHGMTASPAGSPASRWEGSVTGQIGGAVQEWQGPFAGLEGLLAGWAWSAVVTACLLAVAAAWVVRRRSAERHESR
jgi:hypothetical protein